MHFRKLSPARGITTQKQHETFEKQKNAVKHLQGSFPKSNTISLTKIISYEAKIPELL